MGPTRMQFWSLEAPLRTDNGVTMTSLVEGKDGIKHIDVFDSGMLRVTQDSGAVLRIFGRAYGFEVEAKPQEKRKGEGA